MDRLRVEPHALRWALMARGLSPSEFAKESGLGWNTVHRLLRGDGHYVQEQTAELVISTLDRLPITVSHVEELYGPNPGPVVVDTEYPNP